MTTVDTEPLKGVHVDMTTDQPDPDTRWETIDPYTARTYLDENDANRAVRNRVINAYARDMGHGAWFVTGETIKFSKTGELLDGQHRLFAIIESNTAQRMLVVRGLEPETKGIIDTGAPRTAGDALKLVGLGAGNPYAVAAASRLLVLWRTDRLRTMSAGLRHEDRATHNEIIDMVRQEPNLLDAVADAGRDYERTGIPTGPGAMARMVLFDTDAKDAEIFFDALAGYKTDGSNDPRAVLLYTIRQMRALGQMRKPGEAIGLIFTAWNAWRDGQKLTSLTTRDKKGRPLPIPTPL
jgi:hypothetical protein